MPPALTIRTMTPDDVAHVAVAWAAAEGWNPGLNDADAFLAADPEGFLVGEVIGAPVACISAVRYDDAFGFVGFYIVHPEARGRGYGWALWQAGLARLQGVRTVGLDGVVAQQANYARSGFTLAHRNVRYGGPRPAAIDAEAALPGRDAAPFADLVRYDAAAFPTARPAFLRAWTTAPGHTVRLAEDDGALRGYGVVRPCRTGYKVGPLVAEDERLADGLFRALAADVPEGAPLFLDVPAPHAAAVALAGRYGLAPVFETARMYLGPDPGLPLPRIYGITTFELG